MGKSTIDKLQQLLGPDICGCNSCRGVTNRSTRLGSSFFIDLLHHLANLSTNKMLGILGPPRSKQYIKSEFSRKYQANHKYSCDSSFLQSCKISSPFYKVFYRNACARISMVSERLHLVFLTRYVAEETLKIREPKVSGIITSMEFPLLDNFSNVAVITSSIFHIR